MRTIASVWLRFDAGLEFAARDDIVAQVDQPAGVIHVELACRERGSPDDRLSLKVKSVRQRLELAEPQCERGRRDALARRDGGGTVDRQRERHFVSTGERNASSSPQDIAGDRIGRARNVISRCAAR